MLPEYTDGIWILANKQHIKHSWIFSRNFFSSIISELNQLVRPVPIIGYIFIRMKLKAPYNTTYSTFHLYIFATFEKVSLMFARHRVGGFQLPISMQSYFRLPWIIQMAHAMPCRCPDYMISVIKSQLSGFEFNSALLYLVLLVLFHFK